MKYIMFAVKDIVANTFSDIKLFINVEMAKRWFNNLLKESQIARDLQLFSLGVFDVDNGEVTPNLEFVQGGEVNE